MLFSIITVTYNNLDGLRRTASSVAAQQYQGYEWIVIDGGSADGTFDFLKALSLQEEAAGEGFVWASERDHGIYDAMNKGIERASGDYLIFMNAGDEFADAQTLSKIAALQPAADFIYGDSLESPPVILRPKAEGSPAGKDEILRFAQDDNYKRARPCNKIALGMPTHHQSMFYRRGALHGLRYDESFKIAADYKFTAQFLERAETELYCPFPVCRFAPGGISQRAVTAGRREQYVIRRQLRLASAPSSLLIYAAQTALWTFRRMAPRAYWLLKKR